QAGGGTQASVIGPYETGTARVFHLLHPVAPFQRPFRPLRRTIRWDQLVLWKLKQNRIPQCKAEEEIAHLLKFIYASTGENFGIVKNFHHYSNNFLEKTRQRSIVFPWCTFSIWLYLLSHCQKPLCGVFHHINTDRNYTTPLIHLTHTGKLHVQVQKVSRDSMAFQTMFAVPLYQWCRMDVTLRGRLMSLLVTCGEREKIKYRVDHLFKEHVLLDDTDGYFVLGGDNFIQGIEGFLGPAVYHRSKHLSSLPQLSEVILPDPLDKLDLTKWFNKCHEFKRQVSDRFHLYRTLARLQWGLETCPTVYRNYTLKYSPIPSSPQCPSGHIPVPPRRRAVYAILQEMAVRKVGRLPSLELLGRALYRKWERRVMDSEGLARVGILLPLLLQAGCLRFHRAFYLLAVLYQTGFAIKPDSAKALRFGLLAAQTDERLAVMRLGHKHHLGVDGFPVDYDLSSAYYSNIALQTSVDRLVPSPEQVFVESIRLVDENALKEQTKEDDDLFLWLRFKAKKGAAEAQQALGRMLFWGQQGVSQNLKAAVKFYEAGATQLQDPTLMHDYAIVLLKGQGIEKDVPKAVEFLKQAAEKGFVPAINALGWYYESMEKDYQRAVEYWERADELGNAEAPHNLAVLYSQGLYPGKPRDEFTAYTYAWKSATRGYINGGIRLADYWNRGIPGIIPRLPHNAVVWNKWASEQNGYLGAILRKGLDAYLQQSWPEALANYLMAAEAGFEAAQFNMAFLCELNPEGLVSRHVRSNCAWKYYNLSTWSEQPATHALIKMGDLLSGGHRRSQRDLTRAITLYKEAALRNDPRGLYSLGSLIEDGVSVPVSALSELGLDRLTYSNKYTLLMDLYRRCRDHEEEDSFLPCSLALLSVQLKYLWTNYNSLLKCSSVVGVSIVATLTALTAFARLRDNAPNARHDV
ncbi:protein sel-1 homolog 3, partial [Latimeria chalumnae]|uniref:protein sel-1 homolog 3 n=1 Tax=Latimeria chalumnae TaxID=7897 RepID=UPI00313E2855